MMIRNVLKTIGPMALAGALACGGTADEGPAAVDIDALGAAPAAGEEVGIYETRGGHLAELRGAAAADLYDVMDASDGFRAVDRGQDRYLLGRYVACLARGADRLCQVVSADLETGIEGFAFTVHGARGTSAASELFGALARAQGVSPANVRQASSQRFTCGKDTREAWCGLTEGGETKPEPSEPMVELAMRYVGLEDLGPNYVYEGWLITSDGPVTSGRFEVSQNDETFSFQIAESVARDSSLFVLTIEPKFNDDPAPAPTHIVAGDFDGFVANLGVAHGAALGTTFEEADGAYMLAAPSAPGAPYDQGIWFLDPAAGPAPSLDLPTLPSGWVYEGWIVTADGPVSTGRFTDVMGEDSDGAGPDAGPQAGPPFPGQDFVNPPMSLLGTTVVISVEPEPDNSPAPFTLKPLVDMVEDPGGPGVLQGFSNQAADTNPVGITAFFDESGALLR